MPVGRRNELDLSGINDNTVHAQPWMFFPGGGLQQLLGQYGGGKAAGAGGGAGAGASMGGGGTQSLIESVQRSIDAANKANDERYGQALSTVDQGQNDMMAQIQKIFGDILGNGLNPQPALEREGVRARQTSAKLRGDLTSRGLGNTNLIAGVERGVADDSATRSEEILNTVGQQKNAAQQNMLGLILNAIQGHTAAKSGIIERRSDVGPDLGTIAQILMQPGAAGGGANNLLPIIARSLGGSGGGQQTFGGGWQRPAEQPASPATPLATTQQPVNLPLTGKRRTAGGQANQFTYYT